jgi:gliding motility-associated-like protein
MISRIFFPLQIRIFKKIMYQLPLMQQISIVKETTLLLLAFALSFAAKGQDCQNPDAVCPGEGSEQFSFADGSVVANAPSEACFNDSLDAVFFSFSTLNTDQFPFINYTDSAATVQFAADSCSGDTAIGIAVFTASDLCDGSTYDTPLICGVDSSGGGQFSLSGLEPNTTYHVMITNLDTTASPSECLLSVNAFGPALEYDLGAIGYQQDADPNTGGPSTDIFEGDNVVLTVEEDFGEIQWSGPDLNQTTGSIVSASPGGVGIQVDYTASAEIDECIFTDVVSVFIRPRITASNAFSPNGDGINDTWFIDGIGLWPNAQIFIYSRWGNKVFQTTNYENNWTGDDLPAATYYYVIELNPIDFDAEPVTGSVTIVR